MPDHIKVIRRGEHDWYFVGHSGELHGPHYSYATALHHACLELGIEVEVKLEDEA